MIATEALLRTSCALLGLWGMLKAGQWFADLRRWGPGQALGWDLQSLRKGSRPGTALLGWLYSQTGLGLLSASLALTGMALVAAPLGPYSGVLLAAGVGLIQLLARRSGSDGADKIATIAASGALLQALGLTLGNDVLVLAGGLWTGGQLTLAYFAAGASKLILADWRSGAAPRAALTSYMWGNRWSALAMRRAGVARALAWAVMLSEALFPLALLAPLPWLLAALAGMLLLHAGIAVVMGLNTYPLAFLAAYPAVIWLSQWLRTGLGIA